MKHKKKIVDIKNTNHASSIITPVEHKHYYKRKKFQCLCSLWTILSTPIYYGMNWFVDLDTTGIVRWMFNVRIMCVYYVAILTFLFRAEEKLSPHLVSLAAWIGLLLILCYLILQLGLYIRPHMMRYVYIIVYQLVEKLSVICVCLITLGISWALFGIVFEYEKYQYVQTRNATITDTIFMRNWSFWTIEKKSNI